MFTVKTCSLALTKRDGQYNAARWRKFWKSETSFESNLFFLDGVASNVLISREPLEEMSPAVKHGIDMEETESSNHVFLHCSTARQLWSFFLNTLGK